ncbi:unnamed protein product [Effrenium voratum]|nr:unnamed protein product [Effrenium voratum]
MKEVPGRELVGRHLPIHGRGTFVVKALLLHARAQKVDKHLKLWLAAIVSCLLASRLPTLWRSYMSPDKSAEQVQRRARFTHLLQSAGRFAAGPEIVVLVLSSGLNAWLMLYKAWLMREFVVGQNLGRWREWLKALAKFPLAIMASAVLSQTTKYMQVRVSMLWRRAATRSLLRSYFFNMNYYRLQHHKAARIDDPDVRICADVRSACDALTGVLINGLSGVMMSSFSSFALYQRRGLSAVFLPYFYSFVIVPLSYRLTSPDWSAARLVQKANGAYQQALNRVQLAGESVAMLKGQDFEKDVLDHHATKRAEAEQSSWAAMSCFEWFQHFVSNPVMPGVWQTVASFGAAFIAMQAYGPGRPVLDLWQPNQDVVYEYGANISDFWQVFYAVRGSMSFFMAVETYKRSQQNMSRVEQLQDAFETLASEGNEVNSGTFKEGSYIAFDNVAIETPTGVPLLAGLSFQVKPGRHLVICGHNGAGKSSIFRCLAGLWPAKGTITCPRPSVEGGLHGEVYYLPQQPVNIFGTLSDQLTYPEQVSGGLATDELRRWLTYVGLAHFVESADQGGLLTEEADWASRLSLSEQQRLGIARVLYHRPRYAILDECTSAVSKDLENWLFQAVNELGISCVTICHRPALLEQHHQMLRLTGRLAEDGLGWELVDLPPIPEAKPPARSVEEVHARLEAIRCPGCVHQQAVEWSSPPVPSQPSRPSPHLEVVLRRLPRGLQRIAAALQLGRLQRSSKLRAALLVACMLLRPQAAWEVFRTIGGSVGLAMCNDGTGVCAELLINITYASGLCCLDRCVEALSRQLSLQVWSDLASAMHGQALQAAAFHQVDVDNPMQRIAEAKILLDELKSQLQYVGGQTVQMLFCLPLLVRGGGLPPAMALLLLYATHFAVRTYWMPNIKAMTAESSQLEEQFQVTQSRMRSVAEPVAFSGGGEAERLRIEERFERLCEYRLCSLKQEFTYNFLTEFFLLYDNLPIWFHRLISFNFAWRNVPIGGASPASAVQNYLYDRTIAMSLVGVQALTAFPAELAKMDSRATRLLELQEALQTQSRTDLRDITEDSVAAEDLTLSTPNHVVLARELTFQVQRGEAMLITGPNGAGKTALARVLLGLWPVEGKICVPRSFSIVPQRPYLAPGCLGDQVTYPLRFGARDATRATEALHQVGLEYLLLRGLPGRGREAQGSGNGMSLEEKEKLQGLFFECDWEVLSGGEQQRLALSRALFHRPAFAVLDECTSMVAADAEEWLYHAVVQAGVTPLTMSQRLFLPKLHTRELRLGMASPCKWTLAQLQNGSS